MSKQKVKLTFLGYERAGDGLIQKVRAVLEDEDQSRTPRLELTAFRDGLSTGIELPGTVAISRDRLHDLFNGEALDGRAIFALKVVD